MHNLPFHGECDDGQNGGASDCLGEHGFEVAQGLAESPRVLMPHRIYFQGHSWKRQGKMGERPFYHSKKGEKKKKKK